MSAPRSALPRCANCGVEILWRPATFRGKPYCCGGCAQGGPCYCSYDLVEYDVRHPVATQPNGRPVATTRAIAHG